MRACPECRIALPQVARHCWRCGTQAIALPTATLAKDEPPVKLKPPPAIAIPIDAITMQALRFFMRQSRKW